MNTAIDPFFRSAESLSEALHGFEDNPPVIARASNGMDPTWALKPKDLFLEIVAVSLGNLYNRVPLPSPLNDRNMLTPILAHLESEEAGRMIEHSTQWISSEDLVKTCDGRRNQYVLSGRAVTVLSQGTGHGVVGDLLDRACLAYSSGRHTLEIRAGTRALATSILSVLDI